MSNSKNNFLRRNPNLCGGESSPAGVQASVQTEQQVVSAMYAYLLHSWEELPDDTKRTLGFDFVVGSEGEEAALNRLARIFMDYADLSFKRALMARRRRLRFERFESSAQDTP
jgi:hypothetical protein